MKSGVHKDQITLRYCRPSNDTNETAWKMKRSITTLEVKMLLLQETWGTKHIVLRYSKAFFHDVPLL